MNPDPLGLTTLSVGAKRGSMDNNEPAQKSVKYQYQAGKDDPLYKIMYKKVEEEYGAVKASTLCMRCKVIDCGGLRVCMFEANVWISTQ